MYASSFNSDGRIASAGSLSQSRNALVRARITALLLLTALLLAGTAARAQVPAPLAAPDLVLRSNGSVYAMARQPNGGLILGGDFTLIDGVLRQNLARLRPDGSLDPDWNPPVDGPVVALAADGSNAVYVGGAFDKVGNFTRYNIAKIQPNGIVHSSWQPQSNGTVFALAVDAAGTVYAGGYFDQIGGHLSMSGVAKIAGGTGNIDMGWNPCNDSCRVHTLTVINGSLYVGGNFDQIGGQSRQNLAKLSLATGMADAFWDASVDGLVLALATDGNGSLYVGGAFSQIGGEFRTNIAKIDANNSGAADPVWSPPSVDYVSALAWDGSGHLYAGGGGIASLMVGQLHNFLIRVQGNGTGTIDTSWTPEPNGDVWSLLSDGDGRVHVSGSFDRIGGQRRVGLALLGVAGTATANFAHHAETPGVIYALAAQEDGGMIAGGRFDTVNGHARGSLLRLLPNRSLDMQWQPAVIGEVLALAIGQNGAVCAGGEFQGATGGGWNLMKFAGSGTGEADVQWRPHVDGPVYALATQGANLFAGGSFSNINAVQRLNLALLPQTGLGDPDPLWAPEVIGDVHALAVDSGGYVYAGGSFTYIGSHPRWGLAKLTGAGGSGTPTPAWRPASAPFGTVLSLVLSQDEQHLFVGGDFDQIGAQERHRLAKISTWGAAALDSNWQPAVNGLSVNAMALSADGALIIGGDFQQVGGYARYRLARIDSGGTGAPDPVWNPGADGSVHALALRGQGAVFAGGEFRYVGGSARMALAALPMSLDTIFSNNFELE